jgi:hypothetical protein
MKSKNKIAKQLVIPEGADRDEYYLAAMLQNAHAYGLGWTRFAYFRDKLGRPIWNDQRGGQPVATCCAVGAAMLEQDTVGLPFNPVYGNDIVGDIWGSNLDFSGDSVGYAFRCALGDPDE